jgi:hypothetical protein
MMRYPRVVTVNDPPESSIFLLPPHNSEEPEVSSSFFTSLPRISMPHVRPPRDALKKSYGGSQERGLLSQ